MKKFFLDFLFFKKPGILFKTVSFLIWCQILNIICNIILMKMFYN